MSSLEGGEPLVEGILGVEVLRRRRRHQLELRWTSTSKLGGGGGIRTHGTVPRYSGFQDRRLQPLGHPSVSRDRSDSASCRLLSSYGIRPSASDGCGVRGERVMLTTMSRRALDAEIDRLYQLPLDEFTAARNALAKTAGGDAADVRALVKPPIAAWAVNQLHWKDRDVWDALIAAAENVRRAHKAVLAGRAGDVRAANKVHEDAIETAVKATLALLSKAGHPVTDATRQTIGTTIRALPGTRAAGSPHGRRATRRIRNARRPVNRRRPGSSGQTAAGARRALRQAGGVAVQGRFAGADPGKTGGCRRGSGDSRCRTRDQA